jgi:hypothetical protein
MEIQVKTMRNKSDLAYTESSSRPYHSIAKSKAGVSSSESKAIQDELEEQGKIADSDHGRFYLENATGTQF